MINKKIWKIVLIVMIVGYFFISCQSKDKEQMNVVVYRLKWLFNASVAGCLYADVHDIFSQKGIKVSLKEGGTERNAITELELGRAHFGVATADQTIRAIADGSPIVVIAQLFQKIPMCWIYRSNSIHINSANDLKHKKIGITYGNEDETIMRAILAKHNIHEKDVTFFSVKYDYTPFYLGEVDLWPVYENSNGIIIFEKMKKAGESIEFFKPYDYGVNFVANSIITTIDMLETQPVLVKSFLSALLQGWSEALNPIYEEKAISAIMQFDKTTSLDIIHKQLAVTRPLIQPTSKIPIGTIDDEAWKQTEKIMLNQGQISKPIYIEKRLKTEL